MLRYPLPLLGRALLHSNTEQTKKQLFSQPLLKEPLRWRHSLVELAYHTAKTAINVTQAVFSNPEEQPVCVKQKIKRGEAVWRHECWCVMAAKTHSRLLSCVWFGAGGLAQQASDGACFLGVSVCRNACCLRTDSTAHSGCTCGKLALINTSLLTQLRDLFNCIQPIFFLFYFKRQQVHKESFRAKSI